MANYIKILNKYTDDLPKDAISIMRPSILGNPYPVTKRMDRNQVCDQYQSWLREQYRLKNGVFEELNRLAKLYKERGYLDLVCCCKPKRCHGDFIKIAIEGILRQNERHINK